MTQSHLQHVREVVCTIQYFNSKYTENLKTMNFYFDCSTSFNAKTFEIECGNSDLIIQLQLKNDELKNHLFMVLAFAVLLIRG